MYQKKTISFFSGLGWGYLPHTPNYFFVLTQKSNQKRSRLTFRADPLCACSLNERTRYAQNRRKKGIRNGYPSIIIFFTFFIYSFTTFPTLFPTVTIYVPVGSWLTLSVVVPAIVLAVITTRPDRSVIVMSLPVSSVFMVM